MAVRAADDLLVGELADALFTVPGRSVATTWPTRGPALCRSDRVCEVGPRSGSTIVAADPPVSPSPAAPCPAHLVGADGVLGLRYGRHRIAELGIDVEVGHSVLVSTRSATPVRVEGAPLLGGRRLCDGDRVSVGARLHTFRLTGPLEPPPGGGPTHLHLRTPRHLPSHRPTPIELPAPPAAGRLPGLPVVSALVPLLMGGALWAATASMLAAGFMLFSTVFVVAAGFEARREARAERRFRVREYRDDLAEAAADAARARVAQHARLDVRAPGGEAAVDLVGDEPHRIWERVDGELAVRVGSGPVDAEDPVVAPRSGRRDLRDEARSVATAHSPFDGPLLVDLALHGGLAVVGADELPSAAARSALVQLCSALSPAQLAVRVSVGAGRAAAWRWTTWLPHTRGQRTGATRVLHLVDAAPPDEVRELGDEDLLLWVSSTAAGLPGRIGAVVTLGGDGRPGHLDLRDAEGRWHRSAVRAHDLVGSDDALGVARRLAGLTCDDAGPDPVPTGDGVRAMLEDPALLVDHRRVVERWSRAPSRSLAAPVGWAGGAVAHLDLMASGPHALVAGTTGSGKSELLRTLVGSMALHHPPERLSFLLVDYKGGAAFRPLTGLPHVVGMITDLGGDLARRALVSLRAEIRRRERLLAEHHATDLDELRSAAPDDAAASLVVIVDEFAALARELPDFVDGLVDVAQRGRSLGVHLVLATQRPAGVVTDHIRANTTLRIALRMSDPEESLDVVEVPDAAALPRDRPGAAVVRLGPGSTTEVRFAHTGAPARGPARVRVAELTGLPWADDHGVGGTSQLDRLVATTAAAAAAAGCAPPHRPWIDPLPEVMAASGLPDGSRPGCLPVGWVDRPQRQARDVAVVDLGARGGLVVVGAGGSGRTTLLQTLAAAAARHRGECIELRAISSAVPSGPGADHCDPWFGDVVAADDAERVLRLLHTMLDEPSDARRILVVDGFAGFAEAAERVRRGAAVELLARLARDGPRRRCHVVVAAGRRSEVPAALAASMGALVTLRCANEDEAMLAGLDAAACAADVPPGRCWIDGEVVQVALADPRDAPGGWSPPPPVPRVPARVDAATLGAPLLDADRLTPLTLAPDRHLLVAGPPGSGVTSLLGAIAGCSDGPVTVLGPDGLAGATVERLGTAGGTVVVDGLPAVLAHPVHGPACAAALGDLLAGGRARLVAGGEVDELLRCYDDVVTRLRSLRHGVLLGIDPDLHGALLHAEVAPRPELPAGPGRGWFVAPGECRPVLAALPSSATGAGGAATQ